MPAKRLLRSLLTRTLVALGFGLLALGPTGVKAAQPASVAKNSGPASAANPPAFSVNYFGPPDRLTMSMAVGDVNGDGTLDVIQANESQQSVVYLNDGHGGLGAGVPFGGATNTSSLAVGDMNGDGALDIVQGNSARQSYVFFNDGHGNFSFGVPFGGATDPTTAIAVGDVNGDGALDIIQANQNQPSVVYLNDGHGGFAAGVPFGGAYQTKSIVLGDVNGDGKLDIIQGNFTQQSYVYLNDGLGDFGAGIPFGGATDRTYAVALGDVNGDGTLDLIQGNEAQQSYVYLNDGLGDFGAGVPFGTTAGSVGIAVGDVNGDGALDIVQGDFSQVLVYLNGGRGGFGAAIALGGSNQTSGLALADLNGDGALDIVQGNFYQQSCVYLNDGRSGFGVGALFGSAATPTALAVGDANGDGALDIIQGNWNQPSLVYLNDGHGGFGPGVPFGGLAFVDSLAVGDVNGDGALDIIQGNDGQFSRVYLNDGHGGFGAGVPFGGSSGTVSIALGDVNGDGALDILQGRYSQQGSAVFLNDGHGGFGAGIPLGGSAGWFRGLAVGDLNGDGALDIVGANLNQAKCIYFNDGRGGFGPCAPFGNSTDAISAVALGDVNGDGALDIIQGNSYQPSAVYLNDGHGGFGAGVLFGGPTATTRIAVGDVNGDGALDIIQGNNGQPVYGYLNDGHGNFGAGMALVSGTNPRTIAVGDMNGDGALDIVGGNYLFLNTRFSRTRPSTNAPPSVNLARPGRTRNADFFSASDVLSRTVIPITYTLSDPEGNPASSIRAYFSPDGGGKWYPAAAASGTLTTALDTRRYWNATYLTPTIPLLDNDVVTSTLMLTPTSPLVATDVKVWVAISLTEASDLRLVLQAPTGVTVTLMDRGTLSGPLTQTLMFDSAAPNSILGAIAPYGGAYQPAVKLLSFDGLDGSGVWQLRVEDTGPGNAGTLLAWGLSVQDNAGVHGYNWDTIASGFFGHSDDVVFRLEAYPSLTSGPNSVPVFQYPYASATTFPFRVRGTQIQVISGTVPVANAIVYRLPRDQQTGGDLIRDGSGVPFHTDGQGFLMGRGQINPGDQLLALAPVMTSTQGYSLYYTNGAPQNVGVNAFTVTGSGVQVITVTALHPLYLFDLDVSLEWDAHNDNAYLDLLTANLQRTSQYLYDFTDGQAALGDVYVYEGMAGWGSSHIAIHANNRLRPYAFIGGIVTADITDTAPAGVLAYGPGQVTIGSTWNRYGRPGQMLSDDWSLILAHELSHYLFYQDDVYLGLDAQDNLIPVSTCTGSAMGDLYDRPQNTEFIYDQNFWNTACANTLANKTIGRTEWNTLNHWYPAAIVPTYTTALSGPSAMPFDLTTVTVFNPLTPTATLPDPTFYVNYAGTASASSDARAYLFQSDGTGDWMENVGSPGGGQSSLIARGAKPGDTLCVYDATQRQYGCERVAFGNDQLMLTYDPSWNPVLQVTPVNSTTLQLAVSNVPTTGLTLKARLFPDGYYASVTTTLGLAGNVYTGMFSLPGSGIASGNVRVWADGTISDTAMAFSVGGNPGGALGGGGSRGSTGIGGSRSSTGIGGSRSSTGIGGSRSSTGIGGSRSSTGIGQERSGHAPLLSPDGQMIFFTAVDTDFAPGALFAIQAAAGLPALPPGRTQVGTGYELSASPGVTLPVGSISLQYLSNNVPAACADPSTQASCLRLYYYSGTTWQQLPTSVNSEFSEAVAPSQGPGLYALFASKAVALSNLGWNTIGFSVQATQPVSDALASILGSYTVAYNYDSTDSADPWKVYAPGAPAYVDDLQQMRDSQVYWIYATMTTTLYLAPADIQMGLWPPATFYGTVSGSATFTPTAQMTVTATLNGNLCGQALTQIDAGKVVYTIDVDAAKGGANPGCGQMGQAVTFAVGGQAMQNTGVWDDTQVSPVDLAPSNLRQQHVYLPFVQH